MIKKIVNWSIFGSICFLATFRVVHGADILDVSGSLKTNKKYTTNQGIDYTFLGNFSYFQFDSEEKYKRYMQQNENKNFLVLNYQQKDKYGLINIDKAKFDVSSQCTKFSNNNLLKYLYDVKVSDLEQNIFIGNSYEGICYFDENKLYTSRYGEKRQKELAFFVQNEAKIKEILENINIKKDNSFVGEKEILYNLYHFVVKNAEYNHEVVDKVVEDIKVHTPRLVSSFFQGKKIVCDSYTKTLQFIAGFYDISLKRITGKKQPIIASEGERLSHSWLKYKDKYIDPTFEDNKENDVSDTYFLKSKVCFNLDHYKTGWNMFETKQERYDYIRSNYDQLLNSCGENLRKALFQSKQVEKILKYAISSFGLEKLESSICTITKICDIQKNTKDGYLTALGRYNYKYSVDGDVKKIEFSSLIEESRKKEYNEIEQESEKKDSYDLSDSTKEKYRKKVDQIKRYIENNYENTEKVYEQVDKILKTKIKEMEENSKRKKIWLYIYKLFQK